MKSVQAVGALETHHDPGLSAIVRSYEPATTAYIFVNPGDLFSGRTVGGYMQSDSTTNSTSSIADIDNTTLVQLPSPSSKAQRLEDARNAAQAKHLLCARGDQLDRRRKKKRLRELWSLKLSIEDEILDLTFELGGIDAL